MISSGARYVTHGIHFDADSERLKPQSAPVIKSVARGLETNPNLKLRIEGHTRCGRRASDRRRPGSAKPIDSNYTPQGRAQNRRVEFVRQ